MQTTQDLRYPIGRFKRPEGLTDRARQEMIDTIAATPARLRAAVAGLSDAQLDTPYREGGWTVRQVVHHVPDSHLNAYVRFKLALTELHPTIKTYEEAAWAETVDARTAPIAMSLDLLDALHKRWVLFLRSLSALDFQRTFIHPEHGVMTVEALLALYAWHGPHHVAHITALRTRKGW
jgi:uncharacterized damage-inducible protein DinB